MSFQNTLKCMNKLKFEPVECINKPSTTSSPSVSEWSNEIEQLNRVIEEIKENSNEVEFELSARPNLHGGRSPRGFVCHENSPIPVQSEPNIETIKKKKLELQLKMNEVRPEQPNKPNKPNKPKKPMKPNPSGEFRPKKVIISNIANTKTK